MSKSIAEFVVYGGLIAVPLSVIFAITAFSKRKIELGVLLLFAGGIWLIGVLMVFADIYWTFNR